MILTEQRDATYYPSGIYRLTIKGIFFSLSSLIAICNGSVSPSRSTKTGAFILQTPRQPWLRCLFCVLHSNVPDLQRPRPQDPRLLILCHIRRRLPLLPRYHLLLLARHGVLILLLGLFLCSPRRRLISRCYDILCVASIFVCASADVLVNAVWLIEVGLLGLIISGLAVKGSLLDLEIA